MLNQEAILKAISLLPIRVRNRIASAILTRIEEAKEAEKPQAQIEQEVVELILQEIFTNFIQPIEMTKEILVSKALKESPSFRIEFAEKPFDKQFVVENQAFRENFMQMVAELGFSETFFEKGSRLEWKRKEGQYK